MAVMEKNLYGAIEAGGTKMVCAVAHTPTEILLSAELPTLNPELTLPKMIAFFERTAAEIQPLKHIAIGSFGPVVRDELAEDYGKILTTPKHEWQGVNLVRQFRAAFPHTMISLDTDVNVAAAGEGSYGAAKGLHSFVYVTVGTGIGGGVVQDGKLLRGHLHPEIGHLPLPRSDMEDGGFVGCCPFHAHCAEGYASGTAMKMRWGKLASELPPSHTAWEMEADYLALLCQTLTAVLSPQRIILGGGVMQQKGLILLVRERFNQLSKSYLHYPKDYLVTPELGSKAGIIGALDLASRG